MDHPAIEDAICTQVRRVLGNRWWDRGLRERVAGDAWAELAVAVTRGVPYQHHNEWTLRSWVSARVYYAALWALRCERPKTPTIASDVLDSFFSNLPEVGEALDRAERLEVIVAATLELTPRQRQVVLGRLAEETIQSIAARLGCSLGTVCNEFRRACRTLKEALAARYCCLA